MLRIAFRVDASKYTGLGHFSRCLTVAAQLRKDLHSISFLMPSANAYVRQQLAQFNIDLYLLEDSLRGRMSNYGADTNWVKEDWVIDAAETSKILCNRHFDWLIVDHYGIDQKWHKSVRKHVAKIAVIDDLANREHDCDILLDQNILPGWSERYSTLVPKNCIKLIGTRYILLDQEYIPAQTVERNPNTRNVIVFFSSSDSGNFSKSFIETLTRKQVTGFDHLSIVVGPMYSHQRGLTNLCSTLSNVELVVAPRSLMPLFSQSNLAIGSIGAAMWERFYSRCPSLLIPISDNQVRISNWVEQQNLAVVCDSIDNVVDELQHYLPRLSELSAMVVRAAKFVDGFGAKRFSEILTL